MKQAGWRLLCAGAMMMTAASWASAAPPPAPSSQLPEALRGVEAGEWELRGRGDGAETRRVCMADARQLLQIQHGRALCPAFVVSDSANALSVTYDCAAAGNGRTDIRVETSRLVQLRSQGIANGAPFAFAAEGRRVGVCR